MEKKTLNFRCSKIDKMVNAELVWDNDCEKTNLHYMGAKCECGEIHAFVTMKGVNNVF